MRRFIYIICLIALVCSLAACSGSASLENILTDGPWVSGHDSGIHFRFYPDGTGMQYWQDRDTTRTKLQFQWELSGNIIHINNLEDGREVFTITISDCNESTIKCIDQNNDQVTLYREIAG